MSCSAGDDSYLYSSSIRGRPIQSPVGPRTRYRASNASDTVFSSLYSRHSVNLAPGSPLTSPLSPVRSDSKLPPISELDAILPAMELVITKQISSNIPPLTAVRRVAKLTPAPQLKFEPVPVSWKALPLEAALWTLSSTELQSLVSRAIRSSACESSIRLLSLENLDNVLPTEIERLSVLKATTLSKYRFLVHRRTMLLQALNSSSGDPEGRDPADDISVISKLTAQLSQTTAECDQLLEQLLCISDQSAQITSMLDVHWASALAIALRKLNKSYGHRTSELTAARQKIKQLEAELEDAWKEAERIAKEIDDYEAAIGSDEESEAVIETAEKIPLPNSPTSPVPHVWPSGGTVMQVEPLSQKYSFLNAKKKNPVLSPKSWTEETASNRSIKSIRSTKSGRGVRTTEGTRFGLVSAAKTRSRRRSRDSLHLPKSISIPQTPPEDHLPAPEIPLEFTPSAIPNTSPYASTICIGHGFDQRPRRTSLGDIEVVPRPLSGSFDAQTVTITIDDINVRRRITDDKIRIISRTPLLIDTSRFLNVNDYSATQSTASVWPHASTSRTPAGRLQALMEPGGTKLTPYHKLKTLTKRYSFPFLLFGTKSSQRRPASHPSN